MTPTAARLSKVLAPLHLPGRFEAGGGKSKNVQLTGTSLRRDAASSSDSSFSATRCRIRLHFHPVAALDGTVAAQSIARPRYGKGLQASSGCGIRCAELTGCIERIGPTVMMPRAYGVAVSRAREACRGGREPVDLPTSWRACDSLARAMEYDDAPVGPSPGCVPGPTTPHPTSSCFAY